MKKLKENDGPDGKGIVYEFIAERANLDLGETYYWQVLWNLRCPTHSHGSTVYGPCPLCNKGKQAVASPVASFMTEDQAPRWIDIEGRVENIRDLGGWRTEDGRRVRTRMIYRGQGLNDNSPSGDKPGRNRLMVEDAEFMTKRLCIKTDLDLRSGREVAWAKYSPLGYGVQYVWSSSSAYKGIFSDDKSEFPGGSAKQVMGRNFRLFCDVKNYPIYFHCIAGADRTGSLAFMLNGVLGVPLHDLEVDWEATFYPNLPDILKDWAGPKSWRRGAHLTEGLQKYGNADSTLKERIELYLLDCGVTREEIEQFRSIMLE